MAALAVVAWAQILILFGALGPTNGVQIALVPAIELSLIARGGMVTS